MKFITLLILLFSVSSFAVENEKYYSDKICKETFKGKPVRTKKGLYVDCLTKTLAIEFDWAKRPKNYECIGQAIVYAVQTKRMPMCVLLAKNYNDEKFALEQLDYFKRASVPLMIIRVK